MLTLVYTLQTTADSQTPVLSAYLGLGKKNCMELEATEVHKKCRAHDRALKKGYLLRTGRKHILNLETRIGNILSFF
jgi:hypothetical protein